LTRRTVSPLEPLKQGVTLIKIVGALAMAALSVQAAAKDPLIATGKFFCRGDTTMICDNEGNCKKSTSRISMTIDFNNKTLTALNTGSGQPKPLTRVESQFGTIVFSNYWGNVFTITEKEGELIPSYIFKLLLFSGTPIVHFGSCNRL